MRGREKGVKKTVLALTLQRAEALIQCPQLLGLVLFHQGEMGILCMQFSLKKDTSNSFNRETDFNDHSGVQEKGFSSSLGIF